MLEVGGLRRIGRASGDNAKGCGDFFLPASQLTCDKSIVFSSSFVSLNTGLLSPDLIYHINQCAGKKCAFLPCDFRKS